MADKTNNQLFPVINYRPSINLELQCYSRHVYVLTGVNHAVIGGRSSYSYLTSRGLLLLNLPYRTPLELVEIGG